MRIEQVSVQFDHIHLLVRITRRSLFQHFLRVVAGQVAQQFQAHGLGIRVAPQSAIQNFSIGSKAEVEVVTKPAALTELQVKTERAAKSAAVTNTPGAQNFVPSQERASSKNGAVTDTPLNRNDDRSGGPVSSEVGSRTTTPKLWKHRPFTRVVRGWKAYHVVRDYIQLNEKEATGEIRYSQKRLRGLEAEELARLWS